MFYRKIIPVFLIFKQEDKKTIIFSHFPFRKKQWIGSGKEEEKKSDAESCFRPEELP